MSLVPRTGSDSKVWRKPSLLPSVRYTFQRIRQRRTKNRPSSLQSLAKLPWRSIRTILQQSPPPEVRLRTGRSRTGARKFTNFTSIRPISCCWSKTANQCLRQQRQFLDMVNVPFWSGEGPYPSVKVRIDFRGPIIGDFVYHCHILEHEDGGMMAIIRVLPPNSSSAGGEQRKNMTTLPGRSKSPTLTRHQFAPSKG